MTMTWEQAAAEIERVERERAEEYAAKQAAITPHVRKAPEKQPPRMSGPRYFNLMRAMDADAARGGSEYAAYRSTTYCGEPITTRDWDRRSALAAKNARMVDEAGVCGECLRAARAEVLA